MVSWNGIKMNRLCNRERKRTCYIRTKELRNCKVARSRDYGCAGAGEEIWTEPTLVASHLASRWIGANEPEIRLHPHKFVLDRYLQRFDASGANGPLHFR